MPLLHCIPSTIPHQLVFSCSPGTQAKGQERYSCGCSAISCHGRENMPLMRRSERGPQWRHRRWSFNRAAQIALPRFIHGFSKGRQRSERSTNWHVHHAHVLCTSSQGGMVRSATHIIGGFLHTGQPALQEPSAFPSASGSFSWSPHLEKYSQSSFLST